jgi:quinol monooxygenase YgiN
VQIVPVFTGRICTANESGAIRLAWPGGPAGQWWFRATRGVLMIFITARFRVLPQYADRWPEISGEFTRATRAEPGCLWFDWFRSVDDPTEYALTEAFRDGDAGSAHVRSEHFRKAQQTLPPHLAETPRIVNATVPQDDWSLLGEMAVPADRA